MKDEKIKAKDSDEDSDESDGDQLFGDNTIKPIVKEEKKQEKDIKNEKLSPSILT